MNSLTKKLILPLAFSSVFAFNSEAQNFLPGKFKNYREKSKDTLLTFPYYSRSLNNLFLVFSYDLDKDSLWDVAEFFPLKFAEGVIKREKYPAIYLLNLNKDTEPKMLFDRKMDGLNQNEEFYNPEISKTLL